jgi:hypothetical protein
MSEMTFQERALFKTRLRTIELAARAVHVSPCMFREG